MSNAPAPTPSLPSQDLHVRGDAANPSHGGPAVTVDTAFAVSGAQGTAHAGPMLPQFSPGQPIMPASGDTSMGSSMAHVALLDSLPLGPQKSGETSLPASSGIHRENMLGPPTKRPREHDDSSTPCGASAPGARATGADDAADRSLAALEQSLVSACTIIEKNHDYIGRAAALDAQQHVAGPKRVQNILNAIRLVISFMAALDLPETIDRWIMLPAEIRAVGEQRAVLQEQVKVLERELSGCRETLLSAQEFRTKLQEVTGTLTTIKASVNTLVTGTPRYAQAVKSTLDPPVATSSSKVPGRPPLPVAFPPRAPKRTADAVEAFPRKRPEVAAAPPTSHDANAGVVITSWSQANSLLHVHGINPGLGMGSARDIVDILEQYGPRPQEHSVPVTAAPKTVAAAPKPAHPVPHASRDRDAHKFVIVSFSAVVPADARHPDAAFEMVVKEAAAASGVPTAYQAHVWVEPGQQVRVKLDRRASPDFMAALQERAAGLVTEAFVHGLQEKLTASVDYWNFVTFLSVSACPTGRLVDGKFVRYTWPELEELIRKGNPWISERLQPYNHAPAWHWDSDLNSGTGVLIISIQDVRDGSWATRFVKKQVLAIGDNPACRLKIWMPPTRVPHCVTCWRWGHGARSCRARKKHCPKCGEDHTEHEHEARSSCCARERISRNAERVPCPAEHARCPNCNVVGHGPRDEQCPFYKHRYDKVWHEQHKSDVSYRDVHLHAKRVISEARREARRTLSEGQGPARSQMDVDEDGSKDTASREHASVQDGGREGGDTPIGDAA